RALASTFQPARAAHQVLGVGQFDEDVGVAGLSQLAGTRQILALQLARIELFLANEIPVENQSASLPAARFHRGGDVRFATYECVDVLFLEGQLPFRARTHVDNIWIECGFFLPPPAARLIKRPAIEVHTL